MPFIKLRSKNPSASDLREKLSKVRTKSPFVVRLGSRTPLSTYTNPVYRSANEINTIDSIENSRDKLRMKACFQEGGVSQSDWYIWKQEDVFTNVLTGEDVNVNRLLEMLPNGIVMKKRNGFKGHDMFLIKSIEEWVTFKALASSRFGRLEIT